MTRARRRVASRAAPSLVWIFRIVIAEPTFLLLESGDRLLLESGDKIELE